MYFDGSPRKTEEMTEKGKKKKKPDDGGVGIVFMSPEGEREVRVIKRVLPTSFLEIDLSTPVYCRGARKFARGKCVV